jgi:hypothetical protein
LSATDAIRQESTMLADVCKDAVVEDGRGCPIDWPALDVLSSREDEAAFQRSIEAAARSPDFAAFAY